MGSEKHYDTNGNYSGKTDEDGKHYDKYGNYSGKTDRDGKHYDKYGNYDGKADKDGKEYDKYGNYDGKTDKNGKHYDKYGNYDGKSDKGGSGCFITTACIEATGLSHNSTDLNVLREFRDEYVKNLPNGEQIISDYYTIAPRIVTKINQEEKSREIYINLYERLVSKSLDFIRLGEKDNAFKNYLKIVNELKKK